MGYAPQKRVCGEKKRVNYYPFGLKHKGYNNTVTSTNIAQKKKFAGEEFEDELGKNTVAYQWRDYDPAIARFNKIDRYAEKYLDISPYSFTANNPIRFREIKGDSLNITAANPFGDSIEEFETLVANNLGNLYNTNVDENGNFTITRNKTKGKLSKKQQGFLDILNKVIGDLKTTSFTLLETGSMSSNEVIVADNGARDGSILGAGISFEPGTHVLDLGDINQFPNLGKGKSSNAGVLSHELVEGFLMQTRGLNKNKRTIGMSHTQGIRQQSVIDGFTFSSAIITSNSTLEIPLTTSSGTSLPTIEASLINNDITNIKNNNP